MDDPGLNDGEQNGDHPEQDEHPFLKVLIVAAAIIRLKERRDGQDRSRETSYEQHEIMITPKARLVSIMGGKKAILIFQEFIDKPGASFKGLIPIPGGGH